MSSAFFWNFFEKYFLKNMKDGAKWQFLGGETGAPTREQNVRHIIGKLSKFYTTYINFDLFPVWDISIFLENAQAPIRFLDPNAGSRINFSTTFPDSHF